jgi:phosphoglycerate dehydrogenase-like enzyme
VLATLTRHEEDHPARRPRGPRGVRRHEGQEALSHTLFCSATAWDRYGDDWSSASPGLRPLLLPAEGRLGPDDLAAIDIAVFSQDLWVEGRGRPFFGALLTAPNVRWLHMFSAGLDDPVFDGLLQRGVRVSGSAGSSATPIAHTVMLHALALCRNTRAYSAAQSGAVWQGRDALDLEGRRMCIVGMGSIGREVARIAPHFGIEVTGVRRTPDGSEPCPTHPVTELHALLPAVDDLVLTAALTPDSRGLIGAQELALLPRGSHVINVGRGELVDEPALVESLQRGHVGGAALDVFAVEPLDAESPLWHMPHVIVTPHTAGRTPISAHRAAEVFTDNLGRFARGEPLRNERTI